MQLRGADVEVVGLSEAEGNVPRWAVVHVGPRACEERQKLRRAQGAKRRSAANTPATPLVASILFTVHTSNVTNTFSFATPHLPKELKLMWSLGLTLIGCTAASIGGSSLTTIAGGLLSATRYPEPVGELAALRLDARLDRRDILPPGAPASVAEVELEDVVVAAEELDERAKGGPFSACEEKATATSEATSEARREGGGVYDVRTVLKRESGSDNRVGNSNVGFESTGFGHRYPDSRGEEGAK